MAKTGNGYADLGSNHHIAIYRLPDGKADFEIVSLFDASRRLAQRNPIVQRTRADGASFVMSLAAGEAIMFPKGSKKGIWIVQGVWASGQVVLERDTRSEEHTSELQSLMRLSSAVFYLKKKKQKY